MWKSYSTKELSRNLIALVTNLLKMKESLTYLNSVLTNLLSISFLKTWTFDYTKSSGFDDHHLRLQNYRKEPNRAQNCKFMKDEYAQWAKQIPKLQVFERWPYWSQWRPGWFGSVMSNLKSRKYDRWRRPNCRQSCSLFLRR